MRVITYLSALLLILTTLPAIAQTASLQVIHNSPDPAAATVDIYLQDGSDVTKLDDVAFRDATAFLDVPASTYDIIVAGSSSSGPSDQVLFTQSGASLAGGESYIVIASGVLTPGNFAANPDGFPTDFQLLVQAPAQQSATTSDTDVLIVHGSPDAPAVDVIARGSTRLVDGVPYTANTPYLTVAPAIYDLDVALDENNGLIPASAEADLSGAGGAALTVLASGFLDPSANQNGPSFALLAVFADGSTAVLPAATAPTLISELRVDQSGADDDEYFELRGEPGASLDGLTYVVIGDGTTGSGTIENVTDLSGETIPSNGFFVAAEASFTLATADLTTDLSFENGDNVTHLLVYGFTGANGDDLDTDDDGTLDVTPWTIVGDALGLVEDPSSGDSFYGSALQFVDLGPNGAFVPAHAFRAEANDLWQIGNFDNFDLDTPGGSNPIPVELGPFTASINGNDVVLNWTTLSESGNARFDVQKRGVSGSFQTVGTVDGQGTTSEMTEYSFRVADLRSGTYQFRLRQVDIDGGESFSSVVTATINLTARYTLSSIAPNPVTSKATATLQVKTAQSVTAELYDLLGRRVQTLLSGAMSGQETRTLSVDASSLQSGVYFLRVRGEQFDRVQRFVVAR